MIQNGRITDAIKLPPYSKYMKDIVSNKRKIPNEEISTVLADYYFNGKIPKKLGDPGIPTIPCSIKNMPSTEILSLLSFAIYSYPYLMGALLFIAR